MWFTNTHRKRLVSEVYLNSGSAFISYLYHADCSTSGKGMANKSFYLYWAVIDYCPQLRFCDLFLLPGFETLPFQLPCQMFDWNFPDEWRGCQSVFPRQSVSLSLLTCLLLHFSLLLFLQSLLDNMMIAFLATDNAFEDLHIFSI